MGSTNPSSSKGKRPTLGVKAKVDATHTSTYLISLAIKDEIAPLATLRGKSTILNERGRTLLICWRELGLLRPDILPDAAVVTERHFQGIIMVSALDEAAKALAEAIRLFKVLSSLRLAQLGKGAFKASHREATVTAALPGISPPALWKKGYSERIVLGEGELAKVRKIFPGLSVQ